jgi:hypothetical protein
VCFAGIVRQLTGRYLVALCAGLALMLTPIRLPELYQGINWYIEPTLTLLLASPCTYLLYVRYPSSSYRMGLHISSVLLYSASVMTCESGLPWLGVNVFLGWFARDEVPWRERTRLAARDSVLLGTVTQGTGHQLVDSLTFGRAAGVSLLCLTILFATTDMLKTGPGAVRSLLDWQVCY